MKTITPAMLTVPIPAAAAWDLFTRDIGRWWPREYTWGHDAMVDMGIDPREGGLCHEIGPHGFHCDWGRVLEWNPPHRLVLAWQIGPHREPVPDPERASTVEVQFDPHGDDECLVTVVHRDFERHGAGAAAYEEAMNSAQGWPLILQRFATAATA